ncbi:MAG: hypothetical protein M1828_005157 [Chrysothrix sp. TS-e1954]|nr:MAG: hypothetical protein M1828_005157 [Chrysothrix sp. TS-e1954]
MPITYGYSSVHKRRRLSSSPPSSPPPPPQRGHCAASSPTSPCIHEDAQQLVASISACLKSFPRPPLKVLPANAHPVSNQPQAQQAQAQSPQLPTHKPKRRKLTQSTLNFAPSLLPSSSSSSGYGSSYQYTTCATCGMHYNKTQPADQKLHARFCASAASITAESNVGVLVSIKNLWPRAGVRKIRSEAFLADGGGRAVIVEVTPWMLSPGSVAPLNAKLTAAVMKCLRLVERELGAVPIPEREVFDGSSNYRAYMHLAPPLDERQCGSKTKKDPKDGARVVGFLLTESIPPSRLVPPPPPSTPPATATATSRPPTPADTLILGISRIWTSPSHRRRQIAHHMLSAAFTAFKILSTPEPSNPLNSVHGETSRKKWTAFSQPTTSGAALAKRWCMSFDEVELRLGGPVAELIRFSREDRAKEAGRSVEEVEEEEEGGVGGLGYQVYV